MWATSQIPKKILASTQTRMFQSNSHASGGFHKWNGWWNQVLIKVVDDHCNLWLGFFLCSINNKLIILHFSLFLYLVQAYAYITEK